MNAVRFYISTNHNALEQAKHRLKSCLASPLTFTAKALFSETLCAASVESQALKR